MQSKKIIAACYCRLSDDDEQDGTSVTIETQKKILGDYCRDFGIIPTTRFSVMTDGQAQTLNAPIFSA